ncbi:MAG TPA: squalene--hopene cyclase [Solirubrobacterales bacterium]|nr:squalene--hopene cyclase [Solirubrobacterales bacterium]
MSSPSGSIPGPIAADPGAAARDDTAAVARTAAARGSAHLLSLQQADGHWRGELETNVTMDAEDLLLREFLGIREAGPTARAASWIRSQQRDDGSWANFHRGPGDLSTTIEAYVALRLAGDGPESEHMRRAAAFVRAHGGIERSRVFTRIWLALFGAWSWDRVPALPPEMMLLPPSVPLNVYDFACWARQTVVALTVVVSERPRRPLPFTLEELHGAEPWRPPVGATPSGRALVALDRFLHLYERRPLGFLRKACLKRAEEWIVDRQEADGGWGGIQPPWVYSLIALHLRGYPLDHPVMRRGLDGLESFVVDDERGRRLEACQSPVWDTALALIALADAGTPADDPALVRGAEWLLDRQILGRGDWSVRRPSLEPGGWAFEYANANYPDVDDTAEVALALTAVEHPEGERVGGAVARGAAWIEGMQSSDGGWGAFDADNCRALVGDLPFCDFGEVIDPPSADVTAHAVELLARLGRGGDRSVRRGVDWLLAAQEADGSWFGRWGVNHVYGTGAVVPALVAAGLPGSDPRIRRAVAWLESHQNADGGWGEDCRSYDDPEWIGRGESTPSQTAWALLALDAAGERSAAVERGVRWLADAQLEDGSWEEPQFTGTGFPSDFYIAYHLYRQVFPLMALGRCAR